LTPDVIVIGGGFAGLSAATALAERGAHVLVVEARPALGGRATAFTDPATGERVDNGQHVLFGCYHETFRFLRRIGAEGHVRIQHRLAVDMIDRAGRWSRLACPALPSPLHLLAGVMTWSALGWRDRLSVLKMRAALSDVRGGRAEARLGRAEAGRSAGGPAATVREWLVQNGQTPRLIEMLWEPLAVAALNQPIDQAAAASFAAILRPMFGRNPRNAALALPATPLDEMYAFPARTYIEQRRGLVRVSSPATIRGHHVLIRNERLTAPAIICAVPWHALSDLLPEPPAALGRVLDAADRTDASPIVTVNLWFDRVVIDRALVGLPGRTLQWVFDKRAVFGPPSPGSAKQVASHLSLISSGAEAAVARSNQELIDLAVGEVSEALPAARSASLLRAVVVREKKASFSVAPGQPPRPLTRTGVPGLLLAGDWIDTGLPATIEGAVISGHWAADAALEFVHR
jgi:squalene-associated FAD-dependent desaturase